MKKTFALAFLAIMLSVVAVNISYARMIEEPLSRLEPTPDWHCVCETPYCDCVHDCGTPYAACLAAEMVLTAATLGSVASIRVIAEAIVGAKIECDWLLEECKKDCERSHGNYVEYTCYGLEDNVSPPEEEYWPDLDPNAR